MKTVLDDAYSYSTQDELANGIYNNLIQDQLASNPNARNRSDLIQDILIALESSDDVDTIYRSLASVALLTSDANSNVETNFDVGETLSSDEQILLKAYVLNASEDSQAEKMQISRF